MRVSQFASLLAMTLLSTGAMAQENSDTSQSSQNRDPDMQADTVEGQSQGATAQYEMSSEDGQTSDDVDSGDSSDPGSSSTREQLKEGTLQDDGGVPSSSGGEH